MSIPVAVDNNVFDSMVGDWTAESQVMGIPVIESVKSYWDLNHQFLIIESQAVGKDNTSFSFQRKQIIGIDDKGNAKTWSFDSWGAPSVATGTGFFDGDVLTITEGNDVFKQTKTASVSGNDLTVTSKGSVVTAGKDVTYDNTTVYKKK